MFVFPKGSSQVNVGLGSNLFVFGANFMSNFLTMPGHFDNLCANSSGMQILLQSRLQPQLQGVPKKRIFRKIKIGNFVLITIGKPNEL